jgi:hypothetical protein
MTLSSKLITFAIAAKVFDQDLCSTLDSIFMQEGVSELFEIVLVLSSKTQVSIVEAYVNSNFPSYFDALKCFNAARGVYNAYNLALLNSNARYICFIGAGEIVQANSIKWLDNYSFKYLADFIHVGLLIDNSSAYVPNFSNLQIPPHQACIYRRQLAIDFEIKFDERLKVYSDGYFTRMYLSKTSLYIASPRPFINYKSGGLGSNHGLRATYIRIQDLWKVFLLYELSLGGAWSFICSARNQIIMCVAWTFKQLSWS